MTRRLRDPQSRRETAHPTEAAAPATRFWAQRATQALLLIAATVVAMMPLGAAADPPRVVRPLDDLVLTLNSGPHIVDLRGVYWGAPERCEAVSSDDSIVAVSVEGYRMTLTPVGGGEATITATASNEDGSVSHDFKVTVKHAAPTAVGELPAVVVRVGDTLPVELAGAFSGMALTYTASSSAEDNASVSVAGSTASITALAAGTSTIMVTASNTGGSAEQSFAVTVKDVPPAPTGDLPDVTLRVGDDPITVDVAQAFTGSALAFAAASSAENLAQVSLADSTVSVTGLAAGTATVTVTATNSEGTVERSFVVTVKDVPPATTGSLPDVALITGGDAALVELAGSFAGTALVYTATNTGDAVGLSIAGSQVTVAPLVEGEATVTVTATNSEGTASLSFGAAVSTDVAESDALENTVAAIARSTLASVTSAVGARFRAERRATPAPAATTFSATSAHPFGVSPNQGSQIGGALPAWSQNTGGGGAYPASSGPFGYQPAAMTGGLQQMPGMNFTIPLNASGSSGEWTPAADWTFWGHVDHQSFDGSGYDGSLTSLYLGADANFGENWLAGVAVSRSSGDADYEFTSAQASGTGDLDTDMLSVLPYVHWTVGDVAELWAIAGAGWGDVQLERSATAQEGEADLSMWMLSAGGRRTLASAADWDFALMGDAGVLEMQTDGGVGIIDDMNVSVGRIKLGLEGERMIVVDGGNTFSVFGQVSGRHDSGDGDTGSGVELSGGVRYDTAGRVRFEAKARLLSLHSAEDYEENGVSFSAIVQPRPDGSGMSLALSSYLGIGMGANNRPLEQGYGYPGRLQEFGTETDAWGMDARLGYTLGVQRLSGLLTPFAKFDMAGANNHGMRMGIRYDLANTGAAERLNLELSGGQAYDRFRREAHNLVEIRGELRF